MTGRVVIVTGANSGIGFEVARYLCEGGNDVIIASRSEERGKNAVQKIKAANPNALATFMRLDLSSKKSVEEFVEEFHGAGKSLNVLVNNAGVNFTDTKRQFTSDGFEYTMGTNHLGHFLLTSLLQEDLKKSASDGGDCRIVTVTSRLHDSDESRVMGKKTVALDFENLMLDKEGTYNGHQAYKNSKAANVLFTYELARHLEGTGVTATCICPGNVPGSGLVRHNSSAQRFIIRLAGGLGRAFKTSRSIKQAALDICNLVTAEKYKGVTGKYFRHSQLADSSAETRNEENQKKLWEMSGGYLHLEGFEAIEVPPPPAPEEEKKEEEKKESADAEKKEGEEEETKEEGEKKEEEAKNEEEKKEGEEKEAEVKTEEVKEEKTETEEKKEETPKVEEGQGDAPEVKSDKEAIKAEEAKIEEIKAE